MRERGGGLALGAALAAVPLHAAMAVTTDLSPDEAYYLVAARTGATALVDHPPLLPWLLALTDRLTFLPVELRVRVWPIAFSFATSLAAAALVRTRGGSPRAQGVASAVAGIGLLAAAGGFVATPDGPALLALTIALVAAAPAGPRPFLLGASLFAATLAKVVAFPFALALAFAASDRKLRAAALLGPALALPLVIPSLRFQLAHAFAPRPEPWSALAALSALAAAVSVQPLLWSPWVFVRGARSLGALPKPDRFTCAALSGLVLFSAVVRAFPPEPNWWAPGALALVCAGSLGVETLSPRAFAGLALSVAVPTLVVASHVIKPWLPLERRADPTARLHGWRSEAPPVDAPGVGSYGPASVRCVYANDCGEITNFFNEMSDSQ